MELALLIVNSFTLFSLVVAALFAKFYFPSYMKEKAKNLATKEDVAKITEEVEKVKVEYAKSLEMYKGDIWHEQQKLLWAQEECKVKIDIFKKSANLINKFSDHVVNHQIYISSRAIALAFSELHPSIEKEVAQYYRDEYLSYKEKTEKSYLEFRSLCFEMMELSALLAIYFNDSLHNIVSMICKRGNDAIKAPYTDQKIKQKVNELFSKKLGLDEIKYIIGKDYDAQYEPLIPKLESEEFFNQIKIEAEKFRK